MIKLGTNEDEGNRFTLLTGGGINWLTVLLGNLATPTDIQNYATCRSN